LLLPREVKYTPPQGATLRGPYSPALPPVDLSRRAFVQRSDGGVLIVGE